MNRYALVALLLPITGCDSLVNTYEGLTNPLVAEGILLGVEPPQSDEIDLSGTDLDAGTAITVFLADAESADNLEEAPVEGATVGVRGNQIGEVPFEEMGGGGYALQPGQLEYVDHAEWTITMAYDGSDVGKAHLDLPAAAQFDIPEQHDKGQPITLDFTGMGYTAAMVVVLDQNGSVTWSSNSEEDLKDIRTIYNLTHGSEEVGVVEVPGTAFPDESVYALGVAGLNHTEGADLEEMNTVLSSMLLGKMRIYPVVTAQAPQQ